MTATTIAAPPATITIAAMTSAMTAMHATHQTQTTTMVTNSVLLFCLCARVCVICNMLQDLSLKKVRRLASWHKKSKTLSTFAKIGTGGKYLNNVYRDLFRLLRKDGVVEPTMVTLEMRTRRNGVVRVPWPIIAPHEMAHYLVEQGMKEEMLLGNMDMALFWKQFMKEPGMNFSEFEDCVEELIPVRFHGDEGTWVAKKPIMIWSIGGVKHTHDVYGCRSLLTVIPGTKTFYEKRAVPRHLRKCGRVIKRRKMKVNVTYEKAAEFLAWSFQHLARGVFPEKPFVGFSVCVLKVFTATINMVLPSCLL